MESSILTSSQNINLIAALTSDKTFWLATGPWRVYLRWVKDSAKYNEWMNPIDYEVDDSAPSKAGPAGAIRTPIDPPSSLLTEIPEHLAKCKPCKIYLLPFQQPREACKP